MGRSLIRGALLGLGSGLLLGSAYLFVSALRGLRLECPELRPDECALAQQAAAELARYQAVFALALAVGGLGLLLWLKAKVRART